MIIITIISSSTTTIEIIIISVMIIVIITTITNLKGALAETVSRVSGPQTERVITRGKLYYMLH